MRFRSTSQRKAELLRDPHLQEMLIRQPELEQTLDAYLWAYPRSPTHSRRTLILTTAAIGLAGLIVYASARKTRLRCDGGR
jgi:hypothetical protein